MSKRFYQKSKMGTILSNHILNNKRGYFIVTILFFIGIMIGVMFMNHSDSNQIEEISNYFNELVNQMKQYSNTDFLKLLQQSILSNFVITILLWFGASTIIGIPVVYGTVLVKGFSLGYTMSSILYYFGTGKGILVAMSSLLLHNIIFIPTMLATGVSGIKLYSSIMKNKNRENIKLEIIRHTLFCTLMLLLMLISALVEIYGSTVIFTALLKNI